MGQIQETFPDGHIYRTGGDEFVVVLTGSDYEDRKALVEKLKSDYEEAHAASDKEPWERYSAAVGMAENASDDRTVEFVFKRADKAMYEDKAAFKKNFGGYR